MACLLLRYDLYELLLPDTEYIVTGIIGKLLVDVLCSNFIYLHDTLLDKTPCL